MSASQSAKCLLLRATTALEPASSQPLRRFVRPFHASPSHAVRRRPHYASIKAEDLTALNASAKKEYPQLDTTDEALLAKKYTPSQIAAIRAAETSVDTRDLYLQGQNRTDINRITYSDDDFSMLDGVLDKKPQKKGWSVGPEESFKIEFKDDDELQASYLDWCIDMAVKYSKNLTVDLPEEEDEAFTESLFAEWEKFATNPRSLFNASSEKVYKMMEDPAYDAHAPALPKLSDPLVQQTMTTGRVEVDPHMQRLQHRMGWSLNDIKQIRTKVLVRRRVVNQTKMGKVSQQYYLTVAGNGNGLLGIGEGKSTEPEDGMRQSVLAAIRNLKPVQRYENRTIYGEVKTKVGATEVYLRARPPGFGNRAQHLIFEMTRAAGIHDLSASVPRSRNKMNVCKATMEALLSQKHPNEIAKARGRKIVDVRKVYYGGLTL